MSRVTEGQRYFRRGAVRIESLQADAVFARVQGSRPAPYDVRVEWQLATGSTGVRVACTCPNFDDSGVCKHIWALLHAIDATVEDPVPGRQFLRLVRAPELIGRAAPAGVGSTPAVGEAPAWMLPLQELGAKPSRRRTRSTQPEIDAAAATDVLWYIIDVPMSHAHGDLTVQFYTVHSGRGGTAEGRFVRAGLPFLHTLHDLEDRSLVALLVGSQPSEERVSYLASARDRTGYRIDGALGAGFLPRLFATGRVGLRREVTQGEPEIERPLTWDTGDPWSFQLELVEQQGGKSLRFAGTLVRGGQEIDLSAPLLVLAQGYVLFRDTLARLDERACAAFDWIALLRRKEPVVIPAADRDRLVELLARLPDVPHIVWPEGFAWQVRAGEPRGIVEVSANGAAAGRVVRAQLVLDYGGRRLDLGHDDLGVVDPATRTWLRRSPEREDEIVQRLAALDLPGAQRAGLRRGEMRIERAALPHVVSLLRDAGWDVQAQGRTLRPVTGWTFGVTSGIDWFDVDARCDYADTHVALPEILRAVARGESFVSLGDGTLGMLPEDWLARFAPLMQLGESQADNIRFVHSQAALLDALLAEQDAGAALAVDAGFTAARQRLRAFDGVRPRAAPARFTGELREYQQVGLGWLGFLREFGIGGCLADDMGLGKTVQVLALLEQVREEMARGGARRPSLVVVPSSLVHNWIAEAARFTPDLRLVDYTGPERHARRAALAGADLVVTTYGVLRRDAVRLRDIEFEYAILDEAQAIKNATSLSAKASRLLRARHRLAVTGTPVENHLGELWSLFEFLNPGMLGRATLFGRVGRDLAGGVEPEWLVRALRPYILRRTKERVLAELPAKTEQTLYCEMDRKQRRLYDELRDHYRRSLGQRIESQGLARSKMHVLEALLRLRQVACHPGLVDPERAGDASAKLETLFAQLEEVLAEGHKALVFSQFTRLLAIVRTQLEARGIVYEYLDGRTRDRAARVARFQSDAACGVFLVSLKAGGQGLNLTAADYVFLLDPWWNPAVEAQAIDRTHRIGQTRRVFAYRLLCKDTVEDKIAELQAHKRRLAASILTDEASFLRRLTAADLRLLLG